MSDETYDIDGGVPTAEQRRAADAVRELPTPDASPDFRAALRAQFVAGEFGQAGEDAAPARRPRRAASPRPGRAWAWVAPLAVAASLAVLVVTMNRTPHWTISNAGGAHVMVDGVAMPCDDLDPLQAALRPGCRIQVPDGAQLEVVADALALQINGGMDVTLPATPGRWFARDIVSQVGGRGTLRIATSEAFEGARYRIETGPTELLVTGTAFSVMSTPDVVCVCVLEGGIAATLPDGTSHDIPSGGRFTVQREGGAYQVGSMHDSERGALEQLKQRVTTP